ncbi:D-galactonate transporter [Paucibacter oligotrophus]|uniref:Putative tartrate transporter n=1 Tax=Roseateles oligotrophus TaxID=1769250 RepID=A0A840LI67_9BURK|nr:MFS transporter [Roseateles oligotrophus]MBB4844957.1 D-galactonate transporter [Roseateles oligotrophus]
MQVPTLDAKILEERSYRKVAWRLIPFLFLCYVLAYLDRVNVGFAKLQMLSDLKFSDTVYGLGAGIFFIGYFLFEVPSNIILHRMGARVWIARIMVTWGLLSAAMLWVSTPAMFYTMRFLLGVAEAGFFPGIILYLTYWFPAARRARVVALFMTAIALSGVLGGPLSGWMMSHFEGVNGWHGWQWMFLLQGLPSAAVGIWVLFYLDDSIDAAKWLTAEEKALLKANIAQDAVGKASLSTGQVFANGRVWLMSAIYFCFIMGLYGVSFWLPQLIKSTGVKDVLSVGLLTAIPYGCAALAMVLAARSSDRSGERRWHIALAALAGCLGLLLSTVYGSNTVLAMAALSLATMGILSCLPLFWTLPTAFLGGTAAAAGIAIINSVGNLAGFVSPFMVGAIKDATGQTSWGMLMLAASLLLGALLVLLAVKLPARGQLR